MDHFRVYDSIIDDPKILALSMEFRWYFIAILASSSRQVERGSLPTLTDLALHLRVTQGKIKRVVAFFIEHGFIDEDVEAKRLTVHGWHKRQFKSDVSTERVKRFRNAEQNAPETPLVCEHADAGAELDTLNTLSISISSNTNQVAGSTPTEPNERFVLPDWVPKQDWDDFLEMRKKIRKPPTDRAKRSIVKELTKLKTQGHDPAAVLEQSIRKSWQDVFPLKADFWQQTNGHQANGTANGMAPRQSPRPSNYLNGPPRN